METSKPLVRRSTISTSKKSISSVHKQATTSKLNILSPNDLSHIKNLKPSKLVTSKSPVISPYDLSDLSPFNQEHSKGSQLFSSDNLHKKNQKSSKLVVSKSPIICANDITNSKAFQRKTKPGKLTIPARSSLISPNDLMEVAQKSLTKPTHQYSYSHLPNPETTKTSAKDITLDIKQCLKELKQEAEQCLNSSRHASKRHSNMHRTQNDNDLETEMKDSFTTKTPQSLDLLDDLKFSPQIKKEEMTDMKMKIELLMSKMKQTESESKEHEIENKKLKETIKGLEHKIEDFRFFGEQKGVSCSGNCLVF